VRATCGNSEAGAAYIREQIAAGNDRVCVICYTEYVDAFAGAVCVPYGAENDPAALAHGLFDALRRAVEERTDRIFIQYPPDDGIGLAVANRIQKAAGFDVITVE
jgi:L-threonylcarbamoyladenylate synthase